MPLTGGVEIKGLKEFTRGLKKLEPEVAKQFKRDLLDIGQDIIHEAQAHVPVKTGRALESMKTGATTSGAFVAGGKQSVPYYAWLDFGGVLRPTGNRRNTIVRDFRKKGRYLYPAIDKRMPDIDRRANEAVDRAKNASGL